MRHIIVGASAAGLAAAEAILEVDPAADVTLLSDEDTPPYNRPLISYWLAREELRQLLPSTAPVLSRVELRTGVQVAAIDPARQCVQLDSGAEITYDRLLLATGATSKPLGMEGEDAGNVFGLRTAADAARIDQEIQRGAERAVVLGGGLVGIKAAQALVARGVETLLCVTSPYPLSQNVDAAAGALVTRALVDEGVDVRLGYRPLALERRDGRVRGVRFDAPKNMEPCDLVIRGKGVTPRGELLTACGVSASAGVPTDRNLRTPLPQVWAAGDVAATRDRVRGQATVNAIWPAAVEQGRVAGRNMAGAEEEYGGSLAMNSVHIGDRYVISAGIAAPAAVGDQVYADSLEGGQSYRSVVVRDGVLVGAVVVGHPDQAGLLVAAVRQGARLEELPFHPLDPRAHWGRYAFATGTGTS